jgi:hypothetical protein
MAGDFPARVLHGRKLGRRAHQRGGHAIDGDGEARLGEQPMQPPEAGPGTIFVHRLDIGMALAGPGRCAQHVDQEGLRGGVAVQDIILATLFIVEHELHRDVGAAGPVGVGRIWAVAVEVAGIAHRSALVWWCADSMSPRVGNKMHKNGPDGKK